MPEIPEVEAFKSYLQSHCMNKKIEDVAATDTRVIKKISFAHFKKELVGGKFNAIQRKGKYLIIDIAPSHKKLIMHFGLTGFVVATDKDKPVRFEVVSFIFKKEKLAWCTVRKFAKLWLLDNADQIDALKNMGPDPLEITQVQFLALAQKKKTKNVKTFLMDQSIIAGIGNEYSDEILFQAGIDPHHIMKDLTSAQLKKEYLEMKKVLKYAIALQKGNVKKLSSGRTFSADDSAMFKTSYLQAHRHTDMLCPKNKNHKLKKATIGGRTSYYCPIDQK